MQKDQILKMVSNTTMGENQMHEYNVHDPWVNGSGPRSGQIFLYIKIVLSLIRKHSSLLPSILYLRKTEGFFCFLWVFFFSEHVFFKGFL